MKIKELNKELDEDLNSIWKSMQNRRAVRKDAKVADKTSIKELYSKDGVDRINKLFVQLKKIAYGFYIGLKHGEDKTRMFRMVQQYSDLLNKINTLYKNIAPAPTHTSTSEFKGDDSTHRSEYKATTESLMQESDSMDYALQDIKSSLDRYTQFFQIMKQTNSAKPETVKKYINAYNNLDKEPEPESEKVEEPKLETPSVEDFETDKTEEPEIIPRPGTVKNKIQIPVSKKGVIYKIYEIYHQLGPEKRKEFMITLRGIAKDFDPKKLPGESETPVSDRPESSDGFSDDMPD